MRCLPSLLLISLVLLVPLCGFGAQTYTNPIIHADYSDPDVMVVAGEAARVAQLSGDAVVR